MNTYEKLIQDADLNGITVETSYTFQSDRIKGLYCDGVIALNKNINTTSEKKCVLAEEIGHHYTAAGDITDQSKTANIKQERQGRIWAYNRLIGLSGIIQAHRRHCRNRYEMAAELEVTEEFLQEAIDYYKQKYGPYTQIDGYYIVFEPVLSVIEIL